MGYHLPVAVDEVVAALEPRPFGRYVDGTLGGGGHGKAILEAAGEGARLLGIDRDQEALAASAETLRSFGNRVVLVHGSFADLTALAQAQGFADCDGVLLDLGVSSHQVDASARGFSFRHGGPLDMRMDTSRGKSAAELLETLDVDGLASILRRFGELPRARRVAEAILKSPLPKTTDELARRVLEAVPARQRKHHPATLVFQALRIAVNGELEALDQFLGTLPAPLCPGGKVAIISYHSLEDRRVKRAFHDGALRCTCPPRLPICACGTEPILELRRRGALKPPATEIEANPRARSARLRVASRPQPEAA